MVSPDWMERLISERTGFPVAFAVAEVYMVKFNASVGNVEVRMLRIVQIALLIQNLGDTLCTGHTHGHHNKDHGEHHQAHKDIHAVGKKAHQLAGCQAAANDHLGAQPADQKNTGCRR